MRTLISVLIFLIVPLVGLAQDGLRVVDLKNQIEEVEKQIHELELFAQMQDAATYVPKKSRCWTYLEMAEQTRTELKALNEKYAGRANAEYRRQAESLLDTNRRAVEEYRSCFGSVVGASYDKVVAAGVYRYQPFLARYNQLRDKHGDGRVEGRWSELQAKLEHLKEEVASEEPGDKTSAGTIVYVFRDAEVLREGKPIPATQGMSVFVGDEVRTGHRSRARIEWNDRCEKLNAGPTIINIGSETHLTLNESKSQDKGDSCSGGDSLVGLIRGSLRAFTRGWGGQAAFSVRTGTSLCGIRGTEVVVSYDPAWDEAEYWLDHGDAFMVTKSGETSLKPGHVVRIKKGQLRVERAFARDEYASKVAATAESDNLSLEAAMANRPSVMIKPNQSIPKTMPQLSDGKSIPATQASADQTRQAAASKARRDMESLLAAYGNHDWETIMRHILPANRKNIRADLSKPSGEAEILAKANLPSQWRIDCLICETGEKCDVSMILSYSKNPDQYFYARWSLEPDPESGSRDWMVVKSHQPNEKEYQTGLQACSTQ